MQEEIYRRILGLADKAADDFNIGVTTEPSGLTACSTSWTTTNKNLTPRPPLHRNGEGEKCGMKGRSSQTVPLPSPSPF